MSYDCKSPEYVLKTIKDNKIEMVDLRFADLPGLWQHFSVPPRALNLESFAEGVGLRRLPPFAVYKRSRKAT